jgi:effector-binding domain-containing protein
MSAGVRVRAVEPAPTAVVAGQAASQADFQSMWGPMLNEVWAFLRGAAPDGLYRDGHNIMLYKDDIRDVEVGVQVSGSFAPSGRVVPSTLPGGLVVAATHTGPVAMIGDTYRAMREWSEANDYQLADARWEIYGDPDPSTGDFDVEVCWLLAAP